MAQTDGPMTIHDLLVLWLKCDGYDGLYNDDCECACTLDDLVPCGESPTSCFPGVNSPEKAEEAKLDSFIIPKNHERQEMKSRPITFTEPMVRAILHGEKTQSRVFAYPAEPFEDFQGFLPSEILPMDLCPYGEVGDILWVREWFAQDDQGETLYAATHCRSKSPHLNIMWVPPACMPRWASRISLEITDVQIERLQAMTELDARKQGMQAVDGILNEKELYARARRMGIHPEDIRVRFAEYWDRYHPELGHSWDENPWVWVVSFEVIECKEGVGKK